MYIVYGKDDCGFCKRVVQVLESLGKEHTYLKLGEDYQREELLELVSGDKVTYPRIFTGGVLLGGYQELLDSLI